MAKENEALLNRRLKARFVKVLREALVNAADEMEEEIEKQFEESKEELEDERDHAEYRGSDYDVERYNSDGECDSLSFDDGELNVLEEQLEQLDMNHEDYWSASDLCDLSEEVSNLSIVEIARVLRTLWRNM